MGVIRRELPLDPQEGGAVYSMSPETETDSLHESLGQRSSRRIRGSGAIEVLKRAQVWLVRDPCWDPRV